MKQEMEKFPTCAKFNSIASSSMFNQKDPEHNDSSALMDAASHRHFCKAQVMF